MRVVLTEEYNVMVNSVEVLRTSEHVTLYARWNLKLKSLQPGLTALNKTVRN